MKVAVIAHSLRVAGGAVLGRAFVETSSRIFRGVDLRFFLTPQAGYEALPLSTKQCAMFDTSGTVGRTLVEFYSIPRSLREYRPDVLLGLCNAGYRLNGVRQGVLIQDAHLVYPTSYWGPVSPCSRLQQFIIRERLRRALPFVDVVFVQTETMRSRFAECFDFEGPIALFPNAFSASRGGGSQTDEGEPKRARGQSLKLLCLARYYPHKNLETLVGVFERHRSALAGVVCYLTISPDHGPRARKLLARIQRSGLGDVVVNLGPIPPEDLGRLYSDCDAVILPTMLESFSATYLEAMHFGKPILTSDLDFAHEVCGDAAVYFDPWSPDDIKDVILRLMSDEKLRLDLAERGRRRAEARFRSWPEITRDVALELGIPCDSEVS